MQSNFLCPWGQRFIVAIYAWPLHALVVLLCIVFRVSCSVLKFFSVLSFPLHPLLLLSLFMLLLVLYLLCSCLSVTGAWAGAWCGGGGGGLVVGLRVGQAFELLLLPGCGVGNPSPQVPGHLTSMCNTGVN